LSGDHRAAGRTHFTREESGDMRRCYTVLSKPSTDVANSKAAGDEGIALIYVVLGLVLLLLRGEMQT
jgi:hypothetical protein